MSKFIKTYFILILICVTATAYSQHLVPLHKTIVSKAEKWISNDTNRHQTAFKPFVIRDGKELFNDLYSRDGNGKNWFMRKLRYESFIQKETENYRVAIDPVLGFELSKSKDESELYYQNTRGVQFDGRIGNKVSFHSVIFENQVAFQPYVNEFITENNIIPHQSQFKPYEPPISALAAIGYDYTFAEGLVSYNPIENVNIQFGQGKNFVGEGYRSLLLSDNSYSYPYAKGMYSNGKVQYLFIFASYLDHDLPQTAESGFHKKHATIHFLSFDATKWLQIGIFESTVYNPSDSTGYDKLNANYFNPVIFSNTIEYGLNTKNNSLLGINAKISVKDNLQIYGQVMIDDLATDRHGIAKTGFQMGAKWFDAFTVENLFLLGELNHINPYTYSHNKQSQNYSHSHQALAHPLGSNFSELVGTARYTLNNFEFELQGNYINYGEDTLSANFGQNIFMADTTNQNATFSGLFNPAGISTKLLYLKGTLSYLLNPRTNLRIYTGVTFRKKSSMLADEQNTFVFFGLRTFLFNEWFDY